MMYFGVIMTTMMTTMTNWLDDFWLILWIPVISTCPVANCSTESLSDDDGSTVFFFFFFSTKPFIGVAIFLLFFVLLVFFFSFSFSSFTTFINKKTKIFFFCFWTFLTVSLNIALFMSFMEYHLSMIYGQTWLLQLKTN